jgi:VWFA-related protein
MRANEKGWVALAFAVLFAGASLAAQKFAEDEIRVSSRPYVPEAPAGLRVQSNMVEVGVVVRDAKGKPVAGLRQGDFQVFDNGKLQNVSLFSVESAGGNAPAEAPGAGGAPGASAPPPPGPESARRARYVALFFDDRNLGMSDLVSARTAAQGFIREHLQPGDRVGIFTSSSNVTLEFTEDAAKMQDSLARLRTQARRADNGPGSCPRISPFQAYLIVNHLDQNAHDLAFEQAVQCNCRGPRDASCIRMQENVVQEQARVTLSLADQFSQDTLGAVQNVIEYLGKMRGRRLLLLTSSGFLTNSLPVQHKQDKLVDAALRAGVVINSLDAKGLVAEAPGGNLADGPPIVLAQRSDLTAYAVSLASQQREALNDPMAILAEGTGGRFFHNSNDISGGLRELASAPEVTYLLGFLPEGLKADGKFHKLEVKVVPAGHYSLNARRGYYAPAPAKEGSGASPTEKLHAAVLSAEDLADVTAQVATQPDKREDGEPVLRVKIHVDVRDFTFQKRGDRHVQSLHIITALFDLQGKYLAGVEASVNFALTDGNLAWLSERGFEESVTLQAPPGSYRLREVVQEAIQGKLAALSRPVEIP